MGEIWEWVVDASVMKRLTPAEERLSPERHR